MAIRRLINNATLDGSVGGVTMTPERTADVEVLLTDIPFTKSADRDVWLTGDLTFTCVVDNTENTDAIAGARITDVLDLTMFELDETSIVGESTIGGTTTTLVLGTDYTVSYTEDTTEQTGTLIISMSRDIAAGEQITFSFLGEKVSA